MHIYAGLMGDNKSIRGCTFLFLYLYCVMQSQALNCSGSKKLRNMQSKRAVMKPVISFKLGYNKNYDSKIINLQIKEVF